MVQMHNMGRYEPIGAAANTHMENKDGQTSDLDAEQVARSQSISLRRKDRAKFCEIGGLQLWRLGNEVLEMNFPVA